MLRIYNEDCIAGAQEHFKENAICDLMIFDPPFGINESSFGKHYKRRDEFVLGGYVEAPEDYENFSEAWLTQAKRLLKPNGAMYIISGWSKLRELLNAINKVDLHIINHIIWKFNFGVNTTTKYVTSHYHILYLCHNAKAKPKFNTYCQFGAQEKDDNNRSLNYQDLEDVFQINKEYQPGQKKNKNKLPDALIEKLILYSSDEGDIVCDFFLGNFTTAYVARRLGREPIGFEINKESYDLHINQVEALEPGCGLRDLKHVVNYKPENQGKPITEEDKKAIFNDYQAMLKEGKKKKDIKKILCDKYKRGPFAIKNIIDKILEEVTDDGIQQGTPDGCTDGVQESQGDNC